MKKINLIIITVIMSHGMWAQENHTLTFNHLALSVKNLDDSATFYKDVLGLQEITNKTKIEGIRWLSLGEGKELHLVSILKEPVTINKAVHFALSTSDFDVFLKTLEANKISFSDWPGVVNKITIRADGIKQIYFQDPDGYWIEVNSVKQNSKSTQDKDQMASNDTLKTVQSTKQNIDGLKASPANFKLLLENEHVRVLEYTLKPGEKDRPHTHPAKSSYVVSGGKLKVYLENGEELIFDEKAGTADWGDYVGKHYVENIGTTKVTIILTEIKSLKEL